MSLSSNIRTLSDLANQLPTLNEGNIAFFNLLQLRDLLEQYEHDSLVYVDGDCITPFCIRKGVYELYVYEFIVDKRPDPELDYERLQHAERNNKTKWHERLRKLTPIFLPEECSTYSKKLILDWIDYVLEEPEIKRDLYSVFGEDIPASDLYAEIY